MAQKATDAGPGIRDRIVDAALTMLRERGYAGTSVRSIARAGEFNSALIFYYFGSLNGLLLAALDKSSDERLRRYRVAVADASGIEDLAAIAGRIYREDVEGGHITVFSELVGASLEHPELRPEIVARAEPWLDFVREMLDKVLEGSPLAQVLPTRDLAYAVVSFYLGVNLMTHLDTDNTRTEALFELATRLAPLAAPMLQT